MWRLKVLVQFVLAHLPRGEHLNFRFSGRGGPDDPDAQRKAFRTQIGHVSRLNDRYPLAGLAAVEIGTGWTGIGLVTLSLFVGRVHTFDLTRHLRYDLMHELIAAVAEDVPAVAELSGLPEPLVRDRLTALLKADDIDTLLTACRAEYRAPAHATRTGLPDESVDLVFSYGTLEHVTPEALDSLTAESARVLTPTGRAFHKISTHDHYSSMGLDNEVNFLRYPEWLWRFWVQNRIAYHNRLRESQFYDTFKAHGATVLWSDRELAEGDLAAVREMRVARKFRGWPMRIWRCLR